MSNLPNTPVTKSDVLVLGSIMSAAIGNLKVARAIEDAPDSGEFTTFRGTARSLCQKNGAFLADTDIRDAYLRVTGDAGNEMHWPVSELMVDAERGAFVTNPSEALVS